MERDGNGWVRCGCGQKHWGRHGAAGLFLTVGDELLLQMRPGWAHLGGTWAIPGGARDSHESVVAAALREAQEETALEPGLVTIEGVHRLAHPDWRYDTVLASAPDRPHVSEHAESVELRWVPLSEVTGLALHPGFGAALPQLMLPRVSLLIDAANVVGSRPDGWWHDRAGATQRLLDEIEPHVGRVVQWHGHDHLLAHVEVVVEGKARAVPQRPLDSLVRVVRAHGSADDTIAERARTLSAVVVTSDAGLRARVADSVGVNGLWGLLAT